MLFMANAGLAMCAGAAFLSYLCPLDRHVPAFLVVYAALVAVSVGVWLHASRRAWQDGEERTLRAWILTVAIIMRLALMPTPPSPSTDAYRYSWEGRIANAGFDPYRLPPDSKELLPLRSVQDAQINNPGLSSIYPPAALAAFRLAAAASADVRAQKALFAACDVLVCALLIRLLRRRGKSAAWAALYAWHPLVVVEFSAAGHLDSLMTLGVLGGVEFWETRRPHVAALAWSAAALVKVAPILIVPWLFIRRPRAALLLLSSVAAGLIFAAPGLLDAVRGTPESGIAAFSSDWIANPSLYVALTPLIASSTVRRVVLFFGVVAFSLYWARRRGDDSARAFCGVFLAALLASPVVQPWYVLWILPLALLTEFPAALEWSWIVGFMYFAIDPALRESSAHLPWWHWFWLGEYALVYGLLAQGWCNETRLERTHSMNKEVRAWMP